MGIINKILIVLLLVELVTGCNFLEQAGLTCGRFYEATAIEKTLADHAQVVEQIKKMNPGHVFVGAQEVEGCSGKAELVIAHATERDRRRIKQLIGDTFFGIRYRMQNI